MKKREEKKLNTIGAIILIAIILFVCRDNVKGMHELEPDKYTWIDRMFLIEEALCQD